LVVFGILGIFSVSYRAIAKEAFDCVFRRITLRKCTTGLDKRLKSQITGKLMKRSPKTAKFVYTYFEAISWFFTILLIASLAYSAYGAYNYVMFGNCNGQQGGFCVYDVFAGNKTEYSTCAPVAAAGDLIKPEVTNHSFFGPENAELEIIEFGCYTCEYTRKAQPAVEKILETYQGKVKFYFLDFPIPAHEKSKELAIAAECAGQQGKYWSYYARLFRLETPVADEQLYQLAEQQGLNVDAFRQCYLDRETESIVDEDIALGKYAGIYGTPTFFIGNHTHVGPLSYKDFKKIVENELNS